LYAELWQRQSGGFNPVARQTPEPAEDEFPAPDAPTRNLVVERHDALVGHEDAA
jgi:hypothetical protein